MFREGHYLEVIKASEHCAATAIVTVQEKVVKIKKRRVSTNKWLDLEDWMALYEVLEKALIRNSRKLRTFERTKSTRHLEITYAFETSDNPDDRTSLPTIRVKVSPAKRKSKTKERNDKKSCADAKCAATNPSLSADNEITRCVDDTAKSEREVYRIERSPGLSTAVEEYVPDLPNAQRAVAEFKYVPSKKSTLQSMQLSKESNEYVPTVIREEAVVDTVSYVPNSVPTVQAVYDTYEPIGSSSVTANLLDGYVPNSKGGGKKVEEYQPDFTSKAMKFDESYVPSSSRAIRELKKSGGDSTTRESKTECVERYKESMSSRKGRLVVSGNVKREM